MPRECALDTRLCGRPGVLAALTRRRTLRVRERRLETLPVTPKAGAAADDGAGAAGRLRGPKETAALAGGGSRTTKAAWWLLWRHGELAEARDVQLVGNGQVDFGVVRRAHHVEGFTGGELNAFEPSAV